MSEIAPKGSYEPGGPSFYLAVDRFSDTADNLNETKRNETKRNETKRKYRRLYFRIVVRRKL